MLKGDYLKSMDGEHPPFPCTLSTHPPCKARRSLAMAHRSKGDELPAMHGHGALQPLPCAHLEATSAAKGG